MRPVIVYESHDADDFADALADFFLNQMISDQVANRLGAVGITHRGDAPVKGAKQILLQRDAEARYLRHKEAVAHKRKSCQRNRLDNIPGGRIMFSVLRYFFSSRDFDSRHLMAAVVLLAVFALPFHF